jgi:hypothetical protein
MNKLSRSLVSGLVVLPLALSPTAAFAGVNLGGGGGRGGSGYSRGSGSTTTYRPNKKCGDRGTLSHFFGGGVDYYPRSYGHTFPGLIWGDCPISIGILQIRERPSVFGSTGF